MPALRVLGIEAMRFFKRLRQEGPARTWQLPSLDRRARRGRLRLLRRVGAHRVSIWLATGEERAPATSAISATTRPCVRASHLRYGSHAEHGRDLQPRPRRRARTEIDGRAGRGTAHASRRRRARHRPDGRVRHRSVAVPPDGHTPDPRAQPRHTTEWRSEGLRRAGEQLTTADPDEIERRAAAGEGNRALARAFGVSSGYLSEIVHG